MNTVIRFRDVLKNSVLSSRLNVMVDEAANDWLRPLGKNDVIHSQSVERILDSLVLDTIKTDTSIFDPGEIFLLLAAVYLHDIGRRCPTLHHELDAYDQIRMFPSQYYLRSKYEAEAIAQICAAHAAEKTWPISKCDPNYGIADLSSTGRPFNLQRLGALLRIADEIDNTYVRVKGIPDQTGSVRNIIRFINPIHKKGLIEIQAEPETWQEWEDLVKLREYCQSRLREVAKYIEEAGICFYQVWLTPENVHIPFKVPRYDKGIDDLVQTIAMLATENFAQVEIFKVIEDFEISILCIDKKFGAQTITALLIYNSLSLDEARNAKAALAYLREKKHINACTIITAIPPNNETIEILHASGCAVLTLDGLIRNLYDFERQLRRLCDSYEESQIFTESLFINLRATKESGQVIKDIVEYMTHWVNQCESVHLTLLGDFGSGKTTISERLFYDLGKQYLSGLLDRIPILLKLKEVAGTNSIETAITDLFVNQIGIDINYKTFEALNRMGKLILILDGFDEMASSTSNPEASIIKSFREIDKLVEQNGKLILTCRTHFFKENAVIHTLYKGSVLYDAIRDKYGYELLFLEPFTEQQISEYLDKWAPQDSNRYKDLLREIYNLSDLATRPVLLNMIAKTILQLNSSLMATVNAASLYSLYTRFWLERDDWRSELSIPERKYLSQAISTFLFCGDISVIHYNDLPTLVDKVATKPSRISAESLDYELRTCNFLRRDHRGTYSIVHKSFMEYFLATILADQLIEGRQDISTEWFLPNELPSAGKQGVRVANKETYEFFIQICVLRLREMTVEALYELVKGRKRAHSITANTIAEINIECRGMFCAYSLLDDACETNLTTLCMGIADAPDQKKALYWLRNQIEQGITLGINVERVNIFYDALVDAFGEQRTPHLMQLRKSIDGFEAEKDTQESATVETNCQYPFTRTERRKKLEATIAGISDPFELSSTRKAFYRHWERDKAIFDQKADKKQRARTGLDDSSYDLRRHKHKK